jgi:hypothetical protein
MGGLALKYLNVQRLNSSEYQILVTGIIESFKELIGIDVYLIPSYETKPNFGDADILVCSDLENLPQNWRDILSKYYNSKGMYKNGEVTSIEINNFQVDFITIPSRYLEAAKTYYAYNDLGNLMGRIAHKMGFKLGQYGLVYTLRDKDHVIEEIEISTNPSEYFPFLGYDFNKFGDFKTLEDIFIYAASSSYFHPDIYLLHNRNAKSRVRDTKRKTYTEFLKWCETNNSNLCKYDYKNNKQYFLQEAFKHWPNFEISFNKRLIEYNKQKEIKKYFNGDIVYQLTRLQGKELGMFMSNIKKDIDFKQLLKSGQYAGISDFIVEYYQRFNNEGNIK